MKNEKCSICLNVRGRRICKLKENSLICDRCCAKTRTPTCEGCKHYAIAVKYTQEKIAQQKSDNFIVSIDPELEERVDSALTMVEKGKLEAGGKKISELLIQYPNSHTVQFAMGVVRLMQSRYDEAISYFDRAVEIFPYFVEAWFNKAAAHQKKLEFGDAVKAFQKVVEFGDPSEKHVRRAQDFIRDVKKQLKDQSGISLDDYFKSKEIFDEAFAKMGKNEWESAIRGFHRVLNINPNHTQSYGNSGICYAHLGRKEEALRAFDKALELDPNYEPAILNRKLLSSLKEGEAFASLKYATVDYYKEKVMKNK